MRDNKAVVIELEGDIDLSPVSAYDAAVDDGYSGSEEQYAKELARRQVTQEQFDSLPNRLTKFTTTTEKADYHHITDSTAGEVIDFGMEGKTEQDTTSGKNLYSGGDIEFTGQFKTVTLTLAAGTYTFSALVNSTDTDADTCYVFGKQMDRGVDKRTYISFTTGDTVDGRFTIYSSNKSANGEGDTATFKDIQIEAGEVATDYEPYTNGPSPNPDYPQEIVNAGVLNEETGRYEIGCGIRGKNKFNYQSGKHRQSSCTIVELLDNGIIAKGYVSETKPGQDVASSGWVTLNYRSDNDGGVYLEEGAKVTLSADYTVLENSLGTTHTIRIGLHDKNDNSIYQQKIDYIPMPEVNVKTRVSYTFTMKQTGYYAPLFSLNSCLVKVENVQIALGEDMDYVPYQSQQFTLTSDRPLTKWDKLVKRDGVWGWSIYHYHRIMNGTETWIVYSSRGGFACGLPSSITSGTLRGYGVCNWLRVGNSGTAKNMLTLGMSGNSIIYACRTPFYDSALEDKGLANWKAHLNENPLEFYAQTNTEQAFIPLPDEEQELLRNLETYYGVTNVYNEQGCPMWLTYVQDTKTAIDNKFNKIHQALISLGANV